MSVRTLPGVGPATGDHLRRAGITTVEEMRRGGRGRAGTAAGQGARRVAARDGAGARTTGPWSRSGTTKSVSVEDTFDVDLHDRVRVRTEVRAARRPVCAAAAGRGAVGADRGAEGAPVRLLDADPVRDAAGAHGRPGGGAGGGRRGCWRPWTRPAGVRLLGVGVSGARRLHPGGPVRAGGRERAAEAVAEEPAARRAGDGGGGPERAAEQLARAALACRAGRAAHGVRARVGAGQRGGAGDGAVRGRPSRRRGGCGPSRSTTRSWSRRIRCRWCRRVATAAGGRTSEPVRVRPEVARPAGQPAEVAVRARAAAGGTSRP